MPVFCETVRIASDLPRCPDWDWERPIELRGIPIHLAQGEDTRRRRERDHRHRLRSIRPYEYTDAAALLEDFWKEVDEVLRERGALP